MKTDDYYASSDDEIPNNRRRLRNSFRKASRTVVVVKPATSAQLLSSVGPLRIFISFVIKSNASEVKK